MKFDDKKLYINNQKIILDSLINELMNLLPININNSIDILNDHYKFINFIEYIKIFEDYRWQLIKETYNNLKKKLILIKKKYQKIIHIFGVINSYYSLDYINNINNLIINIYDKTCILKIKWINLQKIHYILINKRKNYIRNTKILKIYKLNNEVFILMNKLQEIYSKLKDLNLEKKIF